jgi:hypothetical protein
MRCAIAVLLSALALPAWAATIAQLSWTAPTQNCDGTAVRQPITYRIYYGTVGRVAAGLPASSTGGCSNPSQVVTTDPRVALAYSTTVDVPAGQLSRSVTLPDDGRRYYFALVAINADGISMLTNEVSKVTAAPGVSPPNAPTLLHISWSEQETGPPEMADPQYIANYLNNDGDTADSHQVTSVAVQAGDLLVGFTKWEDGTGPSPSMTDNASGGSNTYTLREQRADSGSNFTNVIAWTAVAKASETLTVTASIGASRVYRRTSVIVFRPASGYTWQFADSSNDGSDGTATTNNTAGSVTLDGSTPGVSAYAVGEYATVTFTPFTGFTELVDNSWTYGYKLLVSSETSLEAGATSNSSQNYAAAQVAVYMVGGGGGARSLMTMGIGR